MRWPLGARLAVALLLASATLLPAGVTADEPRSADGWEALGAERARRGELAAAADAYGRAAELLAPPAEGEPDPASELRRAALLERQAAALLSLGDREGAGALLGEARAVVERHAPGSLQLAEILGRLAVVAGQGSDFPRAVALTRESLAIRERLAPESVEVARGLHLLGIAAARTGDPATAERHYLRALELFERLDPGNVELPKLLTNLGVLARERGELAVSEGYLRRSLELLDRAGAAAPERLVPLGNLGELWLTRGDLERAESYLRRVHAISERVAPASLHHAFLLDRLGHLALEQDHVEDAGELFHRSLAIRRKMVPESLPVARSRASLGLLELRRDRVRAAEEHFEAALGLQRRIAPGGVEVAWTLGLLGLAALERGDLDAAEERYLAALAIEEELAPGSFAEATACHRLAALRRRQGRGEEAISYFERAASALESQTRRLGGGYETRAGFAADRVEIYGDYLDLLVERGELAGAFHLLERSRSRAFLELLAHRELDLGASVAPELEAERRRTEERYDRILGELARRSTVADADERRRLHAELAAARRQRREVGDRIRATAPRLAALVAPEPLDLASVRRLLGPGTLLLSYAVGAGGGHLFAVGPGAGELEVHPLAVGEEELRAEVARFRATLRPGTSVEAAGFRGRRLGRILLDPVAGAVARAERLLILPDGPLHALPFAALRLGEDFPGELAAGGQGGEPAPYLVVAAPIAVASSATVYAELSERQKRPDRRRIAAFGDPVYPGAGEVDATDRRLRAAFGDGVHLDPLPATRGEVERLRRLFPEGARVFLGRDATEEAARSAGDADLLHLACHGLLDPRFPLESALVLSIPEGAGEGRENGLLQAWEIFEQLRLDADLVTLSACDTALGRELAGEGIVGLTRAFQYAGARSVLASLWGVADASTAELMERFYRELGAGTAKDEALRRAQLALLADPDTAHPFHWAAFRLVGDRR